MANCMDCGGSECTCRSAAVIECLTKACQIFTQAIGSDEGYIPSLGSTATRKALDLMAKAGVKPVFHGCGAETKRHA